MHLFGEQRLQVEKITELRQIAAKFADGNVVDSLIDIKAFDGRKIQVEMVLLAHYQGEL